MQMCSKGNCTNAVEFQGVTTEVSWLMQDMLHRLCSFEIYLERVVLWLRAWVTQIHATWKGSCMTSIASKIVAFVL